MTIVTHRMQDERDRERKVVASAWVTMIVRRHPPKMLAIGKDLEWTFSKRAESGRAEDRIQGKPAGHRMRTEEAGEEACQAGGGSGGGFQGGAVRDRVTNRC